MTKQNLIPILLVAGSLAVMLSCEKGKQEPTQTEKVKKLLELEARMNALNSGTGKMTNFMSVIGYSQLRDGTLNIEGYDSSYVSPDSVVVDTVNYWEPFTCAKVTDTLNEDGTHTTIYDYGDGCSEYGNLTKGKVTYIWKNENNNYYSVVMWDHFYSYGVEMNGISKYSFTSDGNSYYKYTASGAVSDSTVSIMPICFNWSGTSTSIEDLTMTYDDGHTTTFRSEYSNVWDSVSYKVTQGDYYYSSPSEGFEYHYMVTEPIITDYKCTGTWIPVSGIESITSTENGGTNTYTLNYGDGTCDNLAELTENGKTSIIDFGELYKLVEPMVNSVVPLRSRSIMK